MALEAGTVVAVGDSFAVNLGGVPIDCRWDSGFTPTEGDPVYVDRSGDRAVARPFSTTPRPEAGTVTSGASGGTVGVLGDDAVTYRARYSNPAPESGTRVALMWQTPARPIIVATDLAPLPTDPLSGGSGAPTAPGGLKGGTDYFPAVASGTARPFGWEPGNVLQGAYGSYPVNRGAWFHGPQLARLAGTNISQLAIFIPRRVQVGSFNSAITLQFWRHTSGGGGSDVTRVEGPHTHAIAANWGNNDLGGDWVPLPSAWVTGLVAAGGGIAIGSSSGSGVNYGGVLGVNAHPASGQLRAVWTRP